MRPIGLVTALFDLVAVAIQLAVLAWATRRLLGIPFSLTRLLLAAILALVLINPIASALIGRPVLLRPYLLWDAALSLAAALLCALVFLGLAEVFVPSGSLPGPVATLRAVPNAWGRYRRYVQVSWILARHGVSGSLRGMRPTAAGGPPTTRLARGLRDALDEAGVAFIKLGQLLASRRDLLPAEFTDQLATLTDRVSPIPWPDVRAVLEEDLGPGLGELAEIDETPLAAASIAQVHAARLITGERVVLKVRRPQIEVLVRRDLQILARWAHRAQVGTAWGHAVGAEDLARGFAESLRRELDFHRELANLTAVHEALASHPAQDVVAPRPYPHLSTERVLVMERLDGTPLNQVEGQAPEAHRPALARRLLTTLLEQILVDGVFHADPHAGNLIVLEDERLGMLDLGSVGRLDRGLREALGRLLLAVQAEDPAALTDALLEIVDAPEVLDERGLRRALGTFLAHHLGPGARAQGEMFWDLARLAARFRLGIPGDVAAALRALATLEGVLAGFAPAFDFIGEARAFGDRRLGMLVNPGVVSQDLRREVLRALPLLRALPQRIDRLTEDLAEGRLSVRLRLTASPSDRRGALGALNLGALTALAATAGVMAVLLLLVTGGPLVTPAITLYHYFAYCLLIICAVLALRVLVVVFRRDRAGPSER
ncbi:MAG: AarF/ABC1/UbiB kinase family protein [Candidatus Dormibacteraeota bacterium]|nr:AarF/ABC1/UbiB kinase family protein [Candidatus Dormibacteraeota bacterium]